MILRWLTFLFILSWKDKKFCLKHRWTLSNNRLNVIRFGPQVGLREYIRVRREWEETGMIRGEKSDMPPELSGVTPFSHWPWVR